jgi:PKHD-type hydroxylase
MKSTYWKWDEAISPEMCDILLNQRKQLDEEQGLVGVHGDVAHVQSIRNSKVCWCAPNHWIEAVLYNHALYANEFANWMFQIGRPERVQLAEYSGGGFYDWHEDWSPLDGEQSVRKLSVVALLSKPEDFVGGEFQFAEGESVELRQGSIIVFPSFVKHRVTPVTDGVRKSAVCWVRGPMTI